MLAMLKYLGSQIRQFYWKCVQIFREHILSPNTQSNGSQCNVILEESNVNSLHRLSHLYWFDHHQILNCIGCLPAGGDAGRIFSLHSRHPSWLRGQIIHCKTIRTNSASYLKAGIQHMISCWLKLHTIQQDVQHLRLSSCWRCMMTLTGWTNQLRPVGCQHRSRLAFE